MYVAKRGMNRRYVPTRPRKRSSDLGESGIGKSTTSLTFDGSVVMPVADIVYPTNVVVVTENLHFSALTNSVAERRRSSTRRTCASCSSGFEEKTIISSK